MQPVSQRPIQHPVCSWCKSPRVVMDAWASWDHKKQTAYINDLTDTGWCADCDGECAIHWKQGNPKKGTK